MFNAIRLTLASYTIRTASIYNSYSPFYPWVLSTRTSASFHFLPPLWPRLGRHLFSPDLQFPSLLQEALAFELENVLDLTWLWGWRKDGEGCFLFGSLHQSHPELSSHISACMSLSACVRSLGIWVSEERTMKEKKR